jgi:hypothetical protein
MWIEVHFTVYTGVSSRDSIDFTDVTWYTYYPYCNSRALFCLLDVRGQGVTLIRSRLVGNIYRSLYIMGLFYCYRVSPAVAGVRSLSGAAKLQQQQQRPRRHCGAAAEAEATTTVP